MAKKITAVIACYKDEQANIRRDELRLMLKTWVNFETGFFEIPKAKNKKGKVVSKTVPIHPQLKPVLLEMIKRSKTKYLVPDDLAFRKRSNHRR